MLLYAENFNQIMDFADLVEIFKYYTNRIGTTLITETDDFLTSTTSNPTAIGDRAERCLYADNNETDIVLPSVQNSRRLVVGFSVGSGALRDGVFVDAYPDLHVAYFPFAAIRVIFARRWYDQRQRENRLFSIEIRFVANDTIDIVFDNYKTSLTAIQPATGIPINRYRKNFFEFYSDSDGAEDSRGTVKVALNGKTIVARDNVINSDYTKWDGDPSNEGSYYNSIIMTFTTHSVSYYYSKCDAVFDYFYICNESGGYYDDFLGPVQVTTMYPDPARPGDVANWVGFKNGIQVSDPIVDSNASLVDTPVIDATATDVDYIEADTENLQDLYYVKNALDPVRNMLNNPIAVNFRTFIKNIFSYGNNNYDKGLLALTKASGNEIERETRKRIMVDQFTYKPLDVYYGVVPKLAVPWTWELLDNMQFGMESSMVRHSIFVGDGVTAVVDDIDLNDYFTQSINGIEDEITTTALYRPMAIGDNIGGDIVFATWTDPTTSEEFYLLAAPATKRALKTWGLYGVDTILPNNPSTDPNCGYYNTSVLYGLGYPAASFCAGLGSGYFLPNINQLRLLSENKSIVDGADLSGGINTLQSLNEYALSSSEHSSLYAQVFYFGSGVYGNNVLKNDPRWVLPIRKVLISEVATS